MMNTRMKIDYKEHFIDDDTQPLIPCSFMVESSRVENSVAHCYK